MTPQEKAKELVEKYKDYVHGYVGSSMLTNYEYSYQVLAQAKKAATITVDEIIFALENLGGLNDMHTKFAVKHWKWVKEEISLLT